MTTKTKLLGSMCLIGLVSVFCFPASQSRAEVDLRAAIEVETVKGDLKSAIELYSGLTQAADRAVAARALVRMGQCYEKLGNAEARKAYERVISEYADQTEAVAEARKYLAVAANRSDSKLPQHQLIWPTLDSQDAGVSPDGRYVAYKGFLKGGLRLRDLLTGEDFELGFRGQRPAQPIISPDNRLVATVTSPSPGQESQAVCLIGIDGTELRTVWQKPGTLANLKAWAPDGRHLLVTFEDQGEDSELALLSLVDGSAKILTSGPGIDATPNAFSPDGRKIVYRKRSGNVNGVWIINADGSGEAPLVVDDARKWNAGQPMWAFDGGRIIFRSNRSGTPALYSLAVADGQPQVSPELLQQNIRDMRLLGLTRDGSLFTATSRKLADVFVADFDPPTGRATSSPHRVNQQYIGAIGNSIAWSPDGRNIVFAPTSSGTSGTLADSASSLVEHSMDSGTEREIKMDGCVPRWFSYLPDGSSVLELDYEPGVAQFFRRVDLANGKASALFRQEMESFVFSQPALSPDGKTLFYSSQTNYGQGLPLLTMQLVRRKLETGESKVLFETKTGGIGLFSISVSPDGKQLAFMYVPPTPERQVLQLVTISSEGGQIRVLQQGGMTNSGTAWTKDGKRILFVQNENGSMQLNSIPAEGGVAQPAGIEMPVYSLALHPDGSRIAFIGGQFRVELWALKNLLPPSR